MPVMFNGAVSARLKPGPDTKPLGRFTRVSVKLKDANLGH